MNKILCLTDFSKAATNAVEYAVLIAKKTGASLTLLHVVHLPILDTSDVAMSATEVAGEHRRKATDKLKALCQYITEKHRDANIKLDFLVREALLGDEVQDLTREEGYNFIVVGSTGGGNTLEEILVGSNTEWIIENVKCPVLSVPLKAGAADFKQIVYASDYQEQDAVALRTVLNFAQLFNASVEIVHVSATASKDTNSKANQFKQKLRTALPEYELDFHEVIHPDEVTGIKDYLTRKNADLLVILKKRKGFFSHLFSQSFSEQLTYQSKLPILFIHE